MRQMWLAAMYSMALALAPALARAQFTETSIVADGLLGTVVEQSGSTIVVSGGTVVGRNVFHSFATFDVGRDSGVVFRTGGAEIDNVIIRVTGGAPSQVEQPIPPTSAEPPVGRPNVFFFNPAGGEFRFQADPPHPRQGAFYTSAQQMAFADGAIFSAASGPQELTAAEPAAFEFRGGARADVSGGTIVFEGRHISLVDEDVNTSRNIEVDARSLTLNGSRLEVTTRAGLKGDPGDPFRIDVAKRVELINGSVLSAYSIYAPRPIQIRARVISILASRITGFVGAFGGSNEGDLLRLEARAVRIGDESEIQWGTEGGRNSFQPIRITASDTVVIDGQSTIQTHGSDAPPAVIAIEDLGGSEGRLRVALRDDSVIRAHWGNGSFPHPDVGIFIRAHDLSIDGATLATGEPAPASLRMALDVKRLFVSGGAELSTSAWYGAALLDIAARDAVRISDSTLAAISGSSARSFRGRISITGSPVVLLDRARLDASGALGGGEVALGSAATRLQAASLNASTIDASSTQGDGGAIAIHAVRYNASPDSSLDASGATSDGVVTIDSLRTIPR
jgi:filamentous hemagglutinin family protein